MNTDQARASAKSEPADSAVAVWCSCGDQIVPDDDAKCGTCAMLLRERTPAEQPAPADDEEAMAEEYNEQIVGITADCWDAFRAGVTYARKKQPAPAESGAVRLPPLPEPSPTSSYDWLGKALEYTAADMQAYARTAAATQPQEW